MILYEILTGTKPFSHVRIFDIPDIVMKGEKPPIPEYVDPSMQKLISDCLDRNPMKRPEYNTIESSLLQYLKEVQPTSSKSKGK